MEVNPATRFVGRGYARSAASTLAQIPPDRRRTLYAVADLLSPLEQTVAAAKENSFSSLNFELISRVMRHYDEVAVMQASGQLNRANFLTRIFTEVPRAASKTNSQIETALSSRIYEEMEANQLPDNPYSLFQIGLLMQNSGATAPEAAELVAAGRTMPPAPYISDGCGNLSELDGTPRGGRATMLADFCRPLGPEFVSGNRAALAPENIVYKVVFPDGRVLRSVFGGARDPHVMSANAAIADLVAAFCGNVHPKQLSAVYYALSQVGTGVLRGGLVQHGIFSTEHMPVTFTLEKNDTTGVITIRYSEPEGLPVHFHWETTIALDGTATSTPMVVTH